MGCSAGSGLVLSSGPTTPSQGVEPELTWRGVGFFLGLILERRGQILMEGELAAMASPARKRLSESVEEVAGDGGEMIGVSNTKRAKVAVADVGMV